MRDSVNPGTFFPLAIIGLTWRRPATLARSKVRYSWSPRRAWWVHCFAILLDSRLLSRLRRPVGRFNPELLCVLGVQPLPTVELHGLGADDASNRLTREQPLKNFEADVPARGAPRNEAAIDVVPEREARAAAERLEFPPGIVVLEHLGSVGSRHSCFQRRGRSHPGELHRSNRTQAPIDVEGSPFAQM